MNKTIIVGDLHLGSGGSLAKPGIDGSLNSRILDQSRLLNWILGRALEFGVDRIILTGDIFDSTYPDVNIILIFQEWLIHCDDNCIDVHIIYGNHDIKRIGKKYISILKVIENADYNHIYFHNEINTIHTNGVSFTLLPFRDKRSLGKNSLAEAIIEINNKLPYELSSIPFGNCKVGIGHLALEKSFYTDEVDDTANELMFPISSFAGYDYIWMGHVHRPQVLSKSNPYAAHIGSMDLSDFGETKHKKIIVLFDPSSENKYKEIVIPTRPLVRFRVEIPKGEDSSDYLLDIIEKTENLDKAIVKLEIKVEDSNAIDIDKEKISKRLFELGVYHIAGFVENKNLSVVPDDKRHIESNSIEPREAIKLVSNIYEFVDDQEKSLFLEEANCCLELLKQKEKE